MSYRTAPGIAMQATNPTDCRHSNEPFDVAFAAVKDKPGLTIADRVVHAAMVSLHRLGRLGTVTQEQIAEWARVSRRTVVRSCQAMVTAGLLLVRRRGQGRPNDYQLVGIDQDALDGRSDKKPRQEASGRPNPARAGTYGPVKEPTGGKNRSTGTKRFADADRPRCPRCPHQEHGATCSRCGCRDYRCSTCGAARNGPHLKGECYRMPT
jgi:hypothetical protein